MTASPAHVSRVSLGRGDRAAIIGGSFLLQSVWNLRTMQSVGFCFALLPVLGGLGITRVEARYPYDGDDFNFVAKGIPSLGLQDRADEGGHSQWSWYHSYADTFDKIEVERLNISTAAIAIIIYYAASTPDPFPKRLSQDAVITYFKEKGLVKTLKLQGTWRKLGFPEDGR